MERVILHCDLNCFYASVELLSHPELAQYPVAVCGDPQARHGIILAKNERAKAHGVRTAETIWQARKKCPNLVLLPAHHQEYHQYSKIVNGIYERYTDLVEPFGIDESWLDVTGTLHLLGGDPGALADSLRQTVRRETGLTISVGVSFNKIFAKLGSDMKKPDATTVLRREDIEKKIWPLPVGDLLFVGQAAVRLLNQYGVRTIGDLAAFDREALIGLMGKQGRQLSDYARGLDHSPVRPPSSEERPKTVGNGLTFHRNLVGENEIRTGLTLLADQVAGRLRKAGLLCGGIQVTIRSPSFYSITRQKPLERPTSLSREIAREAMELVRAAWNLDAPVRMLTVTAQQLLPQWAEPCQIDLCGQDDSDRWEQQEKLERAVDGIREKYGSGAIQLGSASAVGMDP